MRHLLPFLLLLLLSVSCADDLGRRDIFATTSEEVTISFSVDKITLSRAEDDASFNETAIDHAYLLFYPSDYTDFTGAPAAVVKAEVPEAGKLRFKMPQTLEANINYKLVAVANADAYSPSGSDFEAYLKTEIEAGKINSLSDILLLCSESITSSSVTYLPMKGIVNGDAAFRFSRNGGTVYVNVSLMFRRLVSRIDVSNLADNFKLEGVALCNWRDAVSLGNPVTQPGNIKGVLSGSEGSSSSPTFIAPSGDGQSITEALYCFPSSTDSPVPGDQKTTALILKGSYNNGEPSYYRVNLGLNDDGSQLKPNTKYTVSITAVNGAGQPTLAEAYSSTSEEQIVTATVEDWDIEGGNYAMDDEGHVLGVSKTELEFDCDDTNAQEIKVLCSKDLTLKADFIPGDDIPDDAFNVTLSSEPGLSSVTIKPKGANTEDTALTGKCRISASKDGKECLYFDIDLKQLTSADKPYIPEIPDAPVALIPLDNKHIISVSHDSGNGEIVVDGFDPNCFNSFIDIPLQVYIKDATTAKTVKVISSVDAGHDGLGWPLEGRLTPSPSSEYCYCYESFNNKKVCSKGSKEKVEKSTLQNGNPYTCSNKDILYLSIGAMGPDDPEIKRTITVYGLTGSTETFTYTVIIKRRDIIMDDVVLTDSKNQQSWLIFDRNVQDTSKQNVGRYFDNTDKKWYKRQAYNYTLNSNPAFEIPFKYISAGTVFDESQHSLYMGNYTPYANNVVSGSVSSYAATWLDSYLYKETILDEDKTSPFYESIDKAKWVIPSKDILELCKSKMRVSKMRMFLMSDVPAKKDNKRVPICCYWPFRGVLGSEIDDFWFGYYSTDSSTPIAIIYCENTAVLTHTPTPQTGYRGLTRLVRKLTADDLKNYKNNYLGYGSGTCLLNYCHDDTYSSTSKGWKID